MAAGGAGPAAAAKAAAIGLTLMDCAGERSEVEHAYRVITSLTERTAERYLAASESHDSTGVIERTVDLIAMARGRGGPRSRETPGCGFAPPIVDASMSTLCSSWFASVDACRTHVATHEACGPVRTPLLP